MKLSYLFVLTLVGLFITILLPVLQKRFASLRLSKKRRKYLQGVGPYINTAVAVISLIIAIQAYLDSSKSGPEQQAILEKTKAAIDSSTAALKAVLSISRDQQVISASNLSIANKQLEVQESQWKTQQARNAQRPKFDVQYRYKYFMPALTGNAKVDSIINSSTDAVYVEASNDDFIPERKIKDPFYDERKDQYKYVGQNTSEGVLYNSSWFSTDQLQRKVLPIGLSSTRKEGDETRYFYLSLSIKNTGNLTAEDLFVTVSSLRRGLSLTGEGIYAPELMIEADGELAYSQGTKHIPLLTCFNATKEQINLNLKVVFRDGIIGQEMPVRIGVYDRYVKNTPTIIKFKIAPY